MNKLSLDFWPQTSHDIDEFLSFIHAIFSLLVKLAMDGNAHSSLSNVNIPLVLLSNTSIINEKNRNETKIFKPFMARKIYENKKL